MTKFGAQQEAAAALIESFIEFMKVTAECGLPTEDYADLATQVERFVHRVVADGDACKLWVRLIRRVMR